MDRVFDGQKRAPTRRADHGSRLPAAEDRSLASHTIEIRRAPFGPAVKSDISPSQVVGVNQNDVWTTFCILANLRHRGHRAQDPQKKLATNSTNYAKVRPEDHECL